MERTRKRFSVIIPAYNVQEYIKKSDRKCARARFQKTMN